MTPTVARGVLTGLATPSDPFQADTPVSSPIANTSFSLCSLRLRTPLHIFTPSTGQQLANQSAFDRQCLRERFQNLTTTPLRSTRQQTLPMSEEIICQARRIGSVYQEFQELIDSLDDSVEDSGEDLRRAYEKKFNTLVKGVELLNENLDICSGVFDQMLNGLQTKETKQLFCLDLVQLIDLNSSTEDLSPLIIRIISIATEQQIV